MKAGNVKQTDLRLTKGQQITEIVRPWVLLAFYIAFAYFGLWWLAVPAAFATCLAAFVQLHDSIHNALGLSKKGHDRLLSLSALLLLKSGHALKVTHLRHHGQCLSDDDPEGEPAKWTLKQVFLNGPYHIFALRFASLRIAPNTRNIQLLETAATALLLLLLIAFYFVWGSVIGLVYWAVAFVLSALMPLWASYIPHKMASRNPARMAGVKAARFWTPSFLPSRFTTCTTPTPKYQRPCFQKLPRNFRSRMTTTIFISFQAEKDRVLLLIKVVIFGKRPFISPSVLRYAEYLAYTTVRPN